MYEPTGPLQLPYVLAEAIAAAPYSTRMDRAAISGYTDEHFRTIEKGMSTPVRDDWITPLAEHLGCDNWVLQDAWEADRRFILSLQTEHRFETLEIDRGECSGDKHVGGQCCRRHYSMLWLRAGLPGVPCARFEDCGGFIRTSARLCAMCREHWRFCNVCEQLLSRSAFGPDSANGTKKYKCYPCDAAYAVECNRAKGIPAFSPAQHGTLGGVDKHRSQRGGWLKELCDECAQCWNDYRRKDAAQRRRKAGVPLRGSSGAADLAEIMRLLAKREYSVNEVARALGKSRTMTSSLLRTLREQKLVTVRKDGHNSYYSNTSKRQRSNNRG